MATATHILLSICLLFSTAISHDVQKHRSRKSNRKYPNVQLKDSEKGLKSEDYIALALERYIQDFPEAKEVVNAQRTKDGFPLLQSGSCDSDGPVYRKQGHDYTLNVDHWIMDDATYDCELFERVLCVDSTLTNRAPYFALAPTEDYSWGERSVQATVHKFNGCQMRDGVTGHALCNYFFGFGWKQATTEQGMIVPGMWGTSYSLQNWPDDSPGHPKVSVLGNFRAYGNISLLEGDKFWVHPSGIGGCS